MAKPKKPATRKATKTKTAKAKASPSVATPSAVQKSPVDTTDTTAPKTRTSKLPKILHLRPRDTRQESADRKLPNVLVISRKALDVLWINRALFLGIVGIYTVLNIILVRGFSGATDLGQLKDLLSGNNPTGVGSLETSLALFSVLLTASNSTTGDAAGVMQTLLMIITSLAVVWTLRQVMAGEKVRIRDGFYKGMYPLVPVLLLVVVILIELLPLIIGGYVYSLVVGNGIARNFLEIVPWALVYFGGFVLTLYLLSGSIMALYIATLPDMAPMKALRSATKLVRYRRWSVLRKLLFLPFALLVVTALVMLPILFWLTPLAPWMYFLLTMLAIVVVHAYLYTLYRELLA